MTQDKVLEIIQDALRTIILVSSPPLIMGLTVGILVSVFQTITSIQEQTLAFVPKILAVLLSLIIFGAFMMTTLQEFFIALYSSIPDLMNTI